MTRKSRGKEFRAARVELAEKQARKTLDAVTYGMGYGPTHKLRLEIEAREAGKSSTRSARSVRRNLARLERKGEA